VAPAAPNRTVLQPSLVEHGIRLSGHDQPTR
jgi:hypothetical protein